MERTCPLVDMGDDLPTDGSWLQCANIFGEFSLPCVYGGAGRLVAPADAGSKLPGERARLPAAASLPAKVSTTAGAKEGPGRSFPRPRGKPHAPVRIHGAARHSCWPKSANGDSLMFGFARFWPNEKSWNIQRHSRISTLAVHRLPPINLTPDSHFHRFDQV